MATTITPGVTMSSASVSGELPGWVRSYMDALNAHDSAAVVEHMTDDVGYVDLGINQRMEGRSAVREFIGGMETTFSSDYRIDFSRALVDGDSYAVEWTMSGTNDGADPQHGLPATGHRFEIPGVSIGRLRDGKIAENKDYYNLAGYLMQVGLMPAPQSTSTVST
jgi:steroid delta-isomerase-like uncharacterized protein